MVRHGRHNLLKVALGAWLVALAVTPAARAVAGGDWPSSGADLSNSRSQPSFGSIDAAGAARLTEAWAVRQPGSESGNPPTVTGTPAVVDQTAYYGDWVGDLRAVDVRSGRVLWRTRVDTAAGFFAQVNSSPAVQGGSVYVSTGDGHVVAVSRRSGRIRWSTLLDDRFATMLYGSPTVVGRTLIVGVSSVQNAIDVPTRDFQGSVVALDTATGAIRWRTWVMRPGVDGPGGSVWSSAAIDARRGIAYVGTGQAYEKPAGLLNDALLALRLRDGSIVWSRQFTSDDVFTFFGGCCDYDIGAGPNLFAVRGRDVVGVGDKAGRYAVLDRASGRTVWRRRLCRGSHLGGIMTTAAVARGSIWVACNRLSAAGLDLQNPDLGNPTNKSDVFRLDAATGATRWRRRVAGATLGAVTEAGGAVFVPNADGTLRAWDATSGLQLWSVRPGGPLAAGVAIADGRLLVGYGEFAGTPAPITKGGIVAYAIP